MRVLLNNFNYYYLPTMPNNKLSNLLSVIDSISLSETIVIVTKNIQQSTELHDFFKNKGISSLVVQEKNDIESHSNNSQSILIVTNDTISLLKDVTISQVISLFASISLEELKEKANLCHLTEKLVLIELISKFDFQFIQGLYKFSEVVIERFSCIENDKMIENKNARALSFLKTAMSTAKSLQSECLLSSEINNFIDSCNLEDIKSFFKEFFSLSVHLKSPTLDFVQTQTKGTKEFKITLSQGYLDNIVEDSLKDYFFTLPNITAENISQFIVDEKKSTIVLKSKDLTKNDISAYILNNSYSGVTLEVESINEKLIEEMGKFGDSSTEGNAPRRERDGGGSYQRRDRDSNGGGYQRRDRDGGSGYQRREGSSTGGGYQRRDRDGGSGYQRREGSSTGGGYQRRDRDGGSGYQRRDSYSSRPSYGGGYDKFKNNSTPDASSVSGYESKENETRDSKSNYYGKSNYNNNSSSYGEKKSYRSFSNDFGAIDAQNSGKDRSGYDNKRKDFRGGDRRNSGSSYGGGFKKSYDRSSANSSGYNNYSKDRYSKGGSSFQSHKEDNDLDNE
jgi:hypothetical protein